MNPINPTPFMQLSRSRPHPASSVVAVAIACLTFSACGDAAQANGVVVDTLANGAIRVTSPESGIWAPDEAWTLEPELTIGSMMSDGPDSFTRIATLAVDPVGRIYVGEAARREVRVFAPDGTHIRTMGRDGSGPGEFRQIQGMGWGPDTNLWVVDGQNGFVVYDTAGDYRYSRQRPGAYNIAPWPGRFAQRGVVDVGPMMESGYPLIRYTNDFENTDTMRLPVVERDAFVVDLPGGGRASYSVPFSGGLAYHVDHQGNLWTAITSEYRLTRHDSVGDTTLVVQRPFTPVPVTAEDRNSAIEGLQFFVQQGGTVDPSRIPSRKPALVHINSDDGGYLWVRPSVETDLEMTFVSDVFDPSGQYLGRVSSPDGIGLYPSPVITGDRMVAVVQDSLGVQSIRRYRIVGRED